MSTVVGKRRELVFLCICGVTITLRVCDSIYRYIFVVCMNTSLNVHSGAHVFNVWIYLFILEGCKSISYIYIYIYVKEETSCGRVWDFVK